MIFTKIDKKVLLILIATVVVILLVGFMVYQHINNSSSKVQNLTGGAQAESNSSPTLIVSSPQIQIEAQGIGGQGGLTICSDKCGDGICQKTDPTCGKDNNLNCICAETNQDCPDDCKQ